MPEKYGIQGVEGIHDSGQPILFTKNKNTEMEDYILSRVSKSPTPIIKPRSIIDSSVYSIYSKIYNKGDKKDTDTSLYVKQTRDVEPTTIFLSMKFDRDDLLDMGNDNLSAVKDFVRNKFKQYIVRHILMGEYVSSEATNIFKAESLIPINNIDILDGSTNIVAMNDPNYIFKTLFVDKDKEQALTDFYNMTESGNSLQPYTFLIDNIRDIELKILENSIANPIAVMHSQFYIALKLKIGENKSKDEIAKSLGLEKIFINDLVFEPDTKSDLQTLCIIFDPDDYYLYSGSELMVEELDIDYNKQSVLIENRMSGIHIDSRKVLVFNINKDAITDVISKVEELIQNQPDEPEEPEEPEEPAE